MNQVNIFTVHSIIIKNIDDLLERNIINSEVENFRRIYLRNLIPLYMKYGVAIEDRNDIGVHQDRYFKELNRCSIGILNNKLADEYKLEKICEIYQQESIKIQELCSCGDVMITFQDQFLKCASCANTQRKTIHHNSIFQDDNYTSSRGGYKHNGHFLSVYKNIFCLEKYSFNDEVKLNELKNTLDSHTIRNNLDKKDVPHMWFRRELKHLKLSKWFSHINLLKAQLTGYKVPLLTELEDMTLHTYYQIYQKIFDRIKKVGQSYLRCNYVIYKILNQTLSDSRRKSEILNHIFLPEKDTLRQLDLIYEVVCEESDEILFYEPTHRVT